MLYKDIIKNVGQPILIKIRDAIVSREFQNIDFIKKNARLSLLWDVGFLIEISNGFVKYSSEYNGRLWDHPVVWPLAQAEKIYKLEPKKKSKQTMKTDSNLPEVVYKN